MDLEEIRKKKQAVEEKKLIKGILKRIEHLLPKKESSPNPPPKEAS